MDGCEIPEDNAVFLLPSGVIAVTSGLYPSGAQKRVLIVSLKRAPTSSAKATDLNVRQVGVRCVVQHDRQLWSVRATGLDAENSCRGLMSTC